MCNVLLFFKRLRVRVLDLPAPVLKVAAIDPAPGVTLYGRPAAVTVTFKTPIDPTTVNST